MIFADLADLNRDRQWLPEALLKGLDFLAKNNLTALAPGKHPIEGDEIFASVSEYETEDWTEKLPEAHRRYLDIQCIAYGEEIIGWQPSADDLETAEDRLEKDDLIFFRPGKNESRILLLPGRYGIFWPGEVHRPGCSVERRENVKKIVVKIAASLLGR